MCARVADLHSPSSTLPIPPRKACDKNDVVKGVPEAKSGAEASLDESTLKKDPAAEKDPDADAVDSGKATAMFSAHEPSPNAVFWSKLDPPTSPNGTKEAPALKPDTEDAPAFKPVTGGGEPPPPSIKEFPAETPAPAVSALHSAPRVIRPTPLVRRPAALSLRRATPTGPSRRPRSFQRRRPPRR